MTDPTAHAARNAAQVEEEQRLDVFKNQLSQFHCALPTDRELRALMQEAIDDVTD